MKNKKGQNKNVVMIVIVALLLIIGVYYYYSSTHIKTITEHATPADISKAESGTGLSAEFYDCPDYLNDKPFVTEVELSECRKIEIPNWFSSTSSVSKVNDFAIAKSPNPVACPSGLRTECANYATNPDIMCWNLQCVLGNTNQLKLSYSIQNTGSTGVIFNNVQVTSASPAILNSSINKTLVNGLSSGQTASFVMSGAMSISGNGWIGTNQTFIVNASGVSNYDNSIVKVGDQYILGFYNDPISSLSINIVEAV